MLRKYFLAKMFVPLIKESGSPQFRQFLENWFFNKKSTGADLTKMVKICIISICAKKIFFGKTICFTHQRKWFSTILGNFWKIEFWRNIDRRDPYKLVKIWTILNCAKKIFFVKIICYSSQEVFLHNFRQFLKIEYLTKYRQARTLQKWWKFVFSQFVLRKYYLAKLFVPHIKGSVSSQL